MKLVELVLVILTVGAAIISATFPEPKLPTKPPKGYYRAAAVGYCPIQPTCHTAECAKKNIKQNLDGYEKELIYAVNKGSQLVVFPEYGLYSDNFTLSRSHGRELIRNFLEEIPEVSTLPCELNSTKTPITTRLSCLAKNYSVYVVANYGDIIQCTSAQIKNKSCPSDGVIMHNTNVVFDQSGKLIAKYTKYSLFQEPFFDAKKTYDVVTFNTSFGVTFGTFTCFDIYFKQPQAALTKQKIQHYVYPTDWVNIPPSITAIDVQRGWALTNNVNFIAPSMGRGMISSGSGIYTSSLAHTYFFNYDRNQTKTLIADLPKELPKLKTSSSPSAAPPKTTKTTRKDAKKTKETSENPSSSSSKAERYPVFRNFITDNCIIPNPPGSKIPILAAACKAFQPKPGTKGSVTLKNNGITCDYDFSVQSSSNKNSTFIFIAYKGPTGFVESLDLYIQACFLMVCFPIDLSAFAPASSSSGNQEQNQTELYCNIGAQKGEDTGVVFDDIKIVGKFLNTTQLLTLPIASYGSGFLFDEKEIDFDYNATLKLSTKKQLLTLGLYATDLYNHDAAQ